MSEPSREILPESYRKERRVDITRVAFVISVPTVILSATSGILGLRMPHSVITTVVTWAWLVFAAGLLPVGFLALRSLRGQTGIALVIHRIVCVIFALMGVLVVAQIALIVFD